jgi:predicted nucleic acid-binding protein
VSDLVLDASLTLQWFLEDEVDRQYALSVLVRLSSNRAVVPMLWFYEVGNGLLMAHRRKRITFDQIDGFLTRLKALSTPPRKFQLQFSNCPPSHKSTV